MSSLESTANLNALQHLLEIYGADRSRWPVAERLRLSHFPATDPLARRALNEAAALDLVLDSAPGVAIARERALAQRIASAASKIPPGRLNIRAESKPISRAVSSSFMSHAGGLLMAASLVLGIFAGTTSQLSSTFDVVAEALGLADEEPELAVAADQHLSGEDAL